MNSCICSLNFVNGLEIVQKSKTPSWWILPELPNPRRKLKFSFAVSDSIDILNNTGTEIDFAQTIPVKRCLQPIQKFTPDQWKQPPLSEKTQRRGSQEVKKYWVVNQMNLAIENIAAYKLLAQKAAVYKRMNHSAPWKKITSFSQPMKHTNM